ncbi:ArnT family glycosyltransferase [Planctellipticum variicoloris]|uniref:ArnT family glycosyltransferase n=1 Tax=Planctellipticum variicoloris TaxID=3064265 RepID=UPI0030139110|nr:glycosyltransferase family 39 protein [Planctomycetaceae bacterium SH412]
MTESLRHQAFLIAICAAVFLPNLGATHLWEEDEAYFGRTAREMLERHDLVVPWFNGEISLHKPILMYWVIIAGYQAFGVSEFAARFGSTLFGIGSVLLTYHLGRRLFSPGAGFWSGLILATSLHFVVVSRAAVADPELIFFCTIPLLLFASGTRLNRAGTTPSPIPPNRPISGSELSWWGWAGAYAAMGAAVLTKGPVGCVLPTAGIGLFLLLCQADIPAPDRSGRLLACAHWLWRVVHPFAIARTIWSMRPLTGVMILAVVALPWYAAVGYQTDGEWLRGFFLVHNVGRFVNSFESHRGGPLYYLVAICIGTFPWCIWNYQSLRQAWAGLQTGNPDRPAYQLLLAWIGVWIAAFTLAGTKLPHYVLPTYPALAILFGAFVDAWLGRHFETSRNWLRASWLTLILVGTGILVVMPLVAQRYAPGEEILALIGLIPLCGGVWGLWASEAEHRRQAAIVLAGVAALFSVTILGWGAVRIDQHQKSHVVAGWLHELAPGAQPRLAALGCFEASLAYYCNDNIRHVSNIDVVGLFAPGAEETYLITTDRLLAGVPDPLPDGVAILRETPRFLRPEKLLLIGRSDSPVRVVQSVSALKP